MNLARFLSFDIFGVTGWVVLMTVAGYEPGGAGFAESAAAQRGGPRASSAKLHFRR